MEGRAFEYSSIEEAKERELALLDGLAEGAFFEDASFPISQSSFSKNIMYLHRS